MRSAPLTSKLVALAVTSGERSAALPDVPTIAEAGPVKGFEASSWFGLLAPAGTPADIVNRVQQESAKALGAPALKERLLAQGAIPGGNTPAGGGAGVFRFGGQEQAEAAEVRATQAERDRDAASRIAVAEEKVKTREARWAEPSAANRESRATRGARLT